jgi:glutamyl-tRNA synthetase
MVDSKNVRTRMAPSPTGEYHIGHIRTLLYNYAFAKKFNGQFVIRIEDTDQKRLVEGAQDRILQVIRDYGLSWDEGPDIGGPYGPYVQTQRLDIYKKYIQELLHKGLAYYCFCTPERLTEMREKQQALKQIPKYDRHCLNLSQEEIEENLHNGVPYTIRLKVPDNEVITFYDAVRGEIKINTNEIDDQVLIKSDGIPTYHFAVVVDDHLMNISHVMRGDEWISSAPKQILLYRYFGWEVPVFAHLPVFLDPSGKGKMSKRHGSVTARSFLDDGYLPEALLNFLMLLGWNPGDDREIFSLEDFVKEFSLEHLHKKQPIFDRKKLDYINGYYIRQKTDEELAKLLVPFLPEADFDTILAFVPLLKERISTLKDAADFIKFAFEDIDYNQELLLQRNTTKELADDMLNKARELLFNINDWNFDQIQTRLLNLIKENNWNVGQFFMVFRVAVCGSAFTLPVVESLPIIGKEKTLYKLDIALSKLNQ